MIHLLTILLAFADISAGDAVGAISSPRPCRKLTAVSADTTVDAKSTLLKYLVKRGPAFPQELHQFSPGRVKATFVVDTTGNVVSGSAEILFESHVEFGRSVCDFLTRATFTPAVVDGRKMSFRVSSAPFDFFLRP